MSLTLDGTDEGAHEAAINSGCDCIDVDALIAQKGARIIDAIDTRGFDADVFEARGVEFGAVFVFFERACNTADPKQHTLTNLREHRTSRDDVGHGEAATGPEHADG